MGLGEGVEHLSVWYQEPLAIGNLSLGGRVFLAPMAGYTDRSFRTLAREMGAALTYTEMISAQALVHGNQRTRELAWVGEENGPVGIQLFGHDPEVMAEAARVALELGAALIDINMGCPTPKVVKNGDGAALMRDPHRATAVARAVVEAVRKATGAAGPGSVPVTAKIRKGWDEGSVNAVELAGRLQAAGLQAVAVHGRTRDEFYSGSADWEIIGQVKAILEIPVIGNGDIRGAEDVLKMLVTTGCDAVMIGRGAIGNPWLFAQADRLLKGLPGEPPPTVAEKVEVALRHLTMAIEDKGEAIAVRQMRKHLAWYLRGLPGAARLREQINCETSLAGLRRLLSTATLKLELARPKRANDTVP